MVRKSTASLIWLALLLSSVDASRPRPGQTRSKAPLLFEAQPLRQTVREGEPIHLRFRLTNIGNKDVLVNRHFRLFDLVDLRIVGQTGQRVEWCGVIHQIVDTPGAFILLAPRAHAEKVLLVSCDKDARWGYAFPGPGQYEVTATYQLHYPLNFLREAARSALVVKGLVVAKSIQVRVEPP